MVSKVRLRNLLMSAHVSKGTSILLRTALVSEELFHLEGIWPMHGTRNGPLAHWRRFSRGRSASVGALAIAVRGTHRLIVGVYNAHGCQVARTTTKLLSSGESLGFSTTSAPSSVRLMTLWGHIHDPMPVRTTQHRARDRHAIQTILTLALTGIVYAQSPLQTTWTSSSTGGLLRLPRVTAPLSRLLFRGRGIEVP